MAVPVELWDSVLEDDVTDELVEVADVELEITTLAAEIAFRTDESTQEVEGLVNPVKEFAKT